MKTGKISFLTHPDRYFALALIAMAAFMFVIIGGKQEPYSPGALAASTYPRLTLGCIVILSCALLLRPGHGRPPATTPSLRGLRVTGLMAAYITLLDPVGFFILTPLLLVLLPLLAGFRKPVSIAVSALGVTAALYAVFVLVLNIPLPAGILGD